MNRDVDPSWNMDKPNFADQVVISDQTTGRSVAVVYRSDDAPLICAAPKLKKAIQMLLDTTELNLDEIEQSTEEAIDFAMSVLEELGGEENQGDDLCDQCMRSGVQVSRTDDNGQTVCCECDN